MKCSYDIAIRGFPRINDAPNHWNSRVVRACHDVDRFYQIKQVAEYTAIFGGHNFEYMYDQFRDKVEEIHKIAVKHAIATVDFIIREHLRTTIHGNILKYDGTCKPTSEFPCKNGLNKRHKTGCRKDNVDDDRETALEQRNYINARIAFINAEMNRAEVSRKTNAGGRAPAV